MCRSAVEALDASFSLLLLLVKLRSWSTTNISTARSHWISIVLIVKRFVAGYTHNAQVYRIEKMVRSSHSGPWGYRKKRWRAVVSGDCKHSGLVLSKAGCECANRVLIVFGMSGFQQFLTSCWSVFLIVFVIGSRFISCGMKWYDIVQLGVSMYAKGYNVLWCFKGLVVGMGQDILHYWIARQ